MADEPIGFVGLGNMGRPIAEHLVAAGHHLICYDSAGTAGKTPAGATAAASSAEIAGRCPVVFVSLPDGPVVNAVLREMAGCDPRAVRRFVDLSTIGIEWARRNAAQAGAAGIDYLDAPVSGGVAGARAGTIAVMCAGGRDTVRALETTLLAFGGHVFQVGDTPGQAQAMKLLNNFLSGTAMAATSEAIAFGVGQGLDMQTMLDVINASSGQNTATRDKFPNRVVTGSFDAGFRIEQLVKDLGLYEQAATSASASRPVSPAVIDLWRRAAATDAERDITEIYTVVSGSDTDR